MSDMLQIIIRWSLLSLGVACPAEIGQPGDLSAMFPSFLFSSLPVHFNQKSCSMFVQSPESQLQLEFMSSTVLSWRRNRTKVHRGKLLDLMV